MNASLIRDRARRVASAAARRALCLAAPPASADPAYVKSASRTGARSAEQGLRRDNGWLTLAGPLCPLKPGENTFGTGPDNDIVFPEGPRSRGHGLGVRRRPSA